MPQPSSNGKKAAHLLVVLLDAAGEDVVIPGVDGDGSVRQGLRNRGLGLQVEPLGDHVSANQRGQFGMLAFRGIDRLAMAERRFHVAQPAAGFGQVLEPLAVESGLHRAAV